MDEVNNPKVRYESPIVERKNRHYYGGLFVTGGIFLTILWWTKFNLQDFVAVTSIPAAAVVASHLMWRTCLCVEEFFHLTKTKCSYSTLLKKTWTFNNASSVVIIGILAVVLSSSPNVTTIQTMQMYGPIPFALSTCAFALIFIMVRGEECPTWESYTMRHFNGLDYGSGLAHSYFHGYLKLILPARGDNKKSIRERIDEFIEREKLDESQFPVKTLIVLIPSSGYSFPTFNHVPSQTSSNPVIEPVQYLPDHLLDRAGTKERVYRGGAYRISVKSGNKQLFLYALAEGPTAILTFQEACLGSTPESKHLSEHKRDIISNFYRTLQHLINNDPSVRGLADLLYYDDEDVSNPTDVVELLQDYLLKRYKELPGFTHL